MIPNCTEQHIGDDIAVHQRARQAADHNLGEIDQTYRDAAMVHDVAGEDKKRQREQGEVVETRDHLLGDDEDGVVQGKKIKPSRVSRARSRKTPGHSETSGQKMFQTG